MVQPGRVVDPLGDLDEQGQVVGAQVQGSVWAAEVEAAVGTQIPLGVLAGMSPLLPARAGDADLAWWVGGLALPQQRFGRLKGKILRQRRRSVPHRLAELADGL